VDRATAALPTFRLTEAHAPTVARICCRLDGLPLAIELAAARVTAMSLTALAERLENGFRLITGENRAALPRHRTLRASIEWSYSLLSPPEQALLRRCSVFAGGCTPEAAAAVCGEEGSDEHRSDILGLIAGLVERSLVLFEEREGEARYRILETVRQYGRERLVEAGEEAVLQSRQLAYYTELAEESEPHLRGSSLQAMWLRRLDREQDNFRAALAWAAFSDEGHLGLRLAGALRRFWDSRGLYREGRQHLETLLGLSSARPRSVERAKALIAAGHLAYRHCDVEAANRLLAESLALRREFGDRQGVADCLNNLGIVACFFQGDLARARSLYEESLAIFREQGDRNGVGMLLGNLGFVAGQAGHARAAQAFLEEGLALCREVGNRRDMSRMLGYLGQIANDQGDLDAARAFAEESVAIARELKDRQTTAAALGVLGLNATLRGAYAEAHARQAEVLKIAFAISDGGIAVGVENMAYAAGERALHSRATESTAKNAAALERAVRLFGAVEALREAIHVHPISPAQRSRVARCLAAVRKALGDAAFAAAWDEGCRMTMEEACALALQGDAATRRDAG
jgi:non-specific serine/threonine protein kinase